MRVPLACLVLLCCTGNAVADEKKELLELRNTTLNLIQILVDQGIINQGKADELIRQAEHTAEAQVRREEKEKVEQSRDKTVVRVPYVPDFVKDEIREELRSELRGDVVEDVMAQAKTQRWGVPEALPDWVFRIKVKGDIRLRYQGDLFDNRNIENTYPNFQKINEKGGIGKTIDPFLNTTHNRQRQRVRLRLGVGAKISNTLKVGVRIATGSEDDPVSTNQTLGNGNKRFELRLDHAFLKYDAVDADSYPWLTLLGGRFKNPFMSTDLVWDPDVAFEGVAATYRKSLAGSSNLYELEDESRSLFLTLGAFPLQEEELSSRDKWLYAAQLGADWLTDSQSRFKVAISYYNYSNIVGRRNSLDSNRNDFTAPFFLQKGNTLFDIRYDNDDDTNLSALVSDYDLLGATVQFDLARFAPVHIILTGDYIKNIGFNKNEIRKKTGVTVDAKDTGYQISLSVGWPKIKKRRDWQVFGSYKRLERDAVLDAFADSDFHLGGTDAKGWILGGSYGLADNTWLQARWLSSDAIDGVPLGIDTVQVDLNSKF